MSKRIAFVTEEYSESEFSSGGVKLNYELILKLIDKGYSVDIFSKKYLIKNNIANNYFDFEELNKININANYDKIISEKGIYPSDITYIHDHSYKYRFPKMYKSKLSQFLYKLFVFKKHNKRIIKDKLIKQNLDKTSKIVVSSNVLKQDIIKNFAQNEDKIFILPPAVNQNETAKYRQKSDFTIFGLSAIGLKRKGCYAVFKAVKKLRKTHKYFLVKIIYPKYKTNLLLQLYLKLNKLDNYIKFVPIQKAMNEFYSTIDGMLMPSIVEPFGMVAIEAMSNYKPCIATKCCGACDIINDDALICHDENLSEYMKTIIEMDETEYEKLAKDSYEKVKDMTWENFCNQYANILNK